jgi:hypothetical protein
MDRMVMLCAMFHADLLLHQEWAFASGFREIWLRRSRYRAGKDAAGALLPDVLIHPLSQRRFLVFGEGHDSTHFRGHNCDEAERPLHVERGKILVAQHRL